MQICEHDKHHLAGPVALLQIFHALSAVATPIHALGFYCIMFKTPIQMKPIKWLLLNIHIWSVLLDFVLTVVGIPYVFVPAMAGYGLGPYNHPGLFLYLGVTIINTVSISIAVIFENRYHHLFAQNSCWTKYRKPWIVINYILNPLYFLPPQFLIPEQESARQAVWEHLGCLPQLPDNRQLFVLSLDTVVTAVSVVVCESVAAVGITTFLFLNVYHLILQKPNTRLSKRTVMMQRNLSIALIVQSMSSVVWFLIPIQFVIGAIIFDYHNQLLNNFVFVFVACHGISSTIIMILAHRPYREVFVSPIRQLVRKFVLKNHSVLTATETPISRIF